MANIVEKHALVVANSSERCTGAITRRRVKRNRVEESCIDVVIFSSDMNNNFASLHIDILTKITNSKKGTVIKESDHNVLITEFNNIQAHEKEKNKV